MPVALDDAAAAASLAFSSVYFGYSAWTPTRAMLASPASPPCTSVPGFLDIMLSLSPATAALADAEAGGSAERLLLLLLLLLLLAPDAVLPAGMDSVERGFFSCKKEIERVRSSAVKVERT